MVEFFIDVARECFNIGNFNSMMAIICEYSQCRWQKALHFTTWLARLCSYLPEVGWPHQRFYNSSVFQWQISVWLGSISYHLWLSSWTAFQSISVVLTYKHRVALALYFFSSVVSVLVSSLYIYSWHELESCGAAKENLVKGQNSQIWCFRGMYKVQTLFRNTPNSNSTADVGKNQCQRSQTPLSVVNSNINIRQSISQISKSLLAWEEDLMQVFCRLFLHSMSLLQSQYFSPFVQVNAFLLTIKLIRALHLVANWIKTKLNWNQRLVRASRNCFSSPSSHLLFPFNLPLAIERKHRCQASAEPSFQAT